MKYKSISVFFPAFNEQENIKKCILSAKKYLARHFKDYEIIVVASGSTDKTAEIVKALAARDGHIKLVNQNILGYGAALRSGFSSSSKELIFYTDSDNQFNIEEMDKLFPLLKSHDVVSGYRINRKDPISRIIVADVYNLLIRSLFNLKVRDIDASFKIFKRKVLKSMKLKSRTGLIDAEVLIKARNRGFSIGQIGVTHYARTQGQTRYAIGKRNDFFAIVKPKVVIDILKEIKTLWRDLK